MKRKEKKERYVCLTGKALVLANQKARWSCHADGGRQRDIINPINVCPVLHLSQVLSWALRGMWGRGPQQGMYTSNQNSGSSLTRTTMKCQLPARARIHICVRVGVIYGKTRGEGGL